MTKFIERRVLCPKPVLKSVVDILPILPTHSIIQAPPNKKPKLTLSQATLTSYPAACLVCHQHQCEYDPRHGAYFAIKLALEKQLENIWPKKPPDDASGLLVATRKES